MEVLEATSYRVLARAGMRELTGSSTRTLWVLMLSIFRAKRYAPGNTIGRERIQQFAGALSGQGASKGVFVTTSSFSKNAIEYAHKITHKIVLIDGEELTRLMVQYGVGVRIERTIDIKRIDTDYFDENEE